MAINEVDEFLKPNAALDRLIYEYKTYGYLCVGYDFDNTVSPFGDSKATYNQVIQLIKDLRANIVCRLVCWTANPNIDYVTKYLIENEIPYDGINSDGIQVNWKCRKPIFSALLDDRAGLKETYECLVDFLEIVKTQQDA